MKNILLIKPSFLLFILLIFPPLIYAQAAWPGSWVDYRLAGGGYITDASDGISARADLTSWSGSVLKVASDGTNVFFRLGIGDDLNIPSVTGMAYKIAIADVNGSILCYVTLDALDFTNFYVRVLNNDGSLNSETNYSASPGIAQSTAAGGEYYVDFQAAIASLPGVTSATVIKFFAYSREASNPGEYSDYMTGGSVDFSSLAPAAMNDISNGYLLLDTISGNTGTGSVTLSYSVNGVPQTVVSDASGNYSFTVPSAWSGTVTPSKTGFSFNPVNKVYTTVMTNQAAQDYSASVLVYTISGNTGAGTTTLSYTDGTLKTATSDASGNYSFFVSYNWNGTVTPSKTGFSFTPVNKAYTNVVSNQTSQNYTAQAITYTISGNTGQPGVTLSYTDGTAKTATSDGSGNYSITVSYSWSGTLVPAKAGYTFSPVNKAFTNVLANQTQNFTASPAVYTIAGNTGTGTVTLSYTDGTAKTATSNASGVYSFTVSYNWSGTVVPSKTGFTFSPVNRPYTNVVSNRSGQNYTATAITYIISGNTGTGGVTLSYTDGTAKTATSDASGNYSFTVSYNWSGTVTPSKTGFSFTPAQRTYSNVLVNQTTQNYSATAITYIISGNTVTDNVTLSYTDGSAKTAASDASGNYSFSVSYNWSGSVTPSRTGYSFSPALRTYTNVLANHTSENFTGTAITYTISGNTGTGGVTLSYTDGTAKTATSDASGNYSFTVSYNWSGIVTPSKTGFAFTAVQKTYSNVLSNQASQDYTAAAIVYTISGNTGTGNVTLSYTDGTAKTVVSDASGNYSFNVSYNWSGTVTPSKTQYEFLPAGRNYSNVLANQPSQDYSSELITPVISGNTGVAGVTLSYIDGVNKTVTSDASGNYSFIVSYGWSGTVTPYKESYSFSPSYRSYNNLMANQPAQNYSASTIHFTISGNAGTGKAVLNYFDGTAKNVTADETGYFSIVVPYNWSGTITPVLEGYNFTPYRMSYNNVLENKISQDFSADLVFFSIYGNTGKGGVSLNYFDKTEKSIVSDSLGNYRIDVPFHWSGTITPFKEGYSITPVNRKYDKINSNLFSEDYTSILLTYSISGNTGTGFVKINCSASGTPLSVISDTEGYYNFSVPYNWGGVLIPAKTGFTFNPDSLELKNVKSNLSGINFTPEPITYRISGSTGIPGVTLSYFDSTSKTTVSDVEGKYSLSVSYNWSGTVSPSKEGFLFSPLVRKYSNVLSDYPEQNFKTDSIVFIISGNTGTGGVVINYTDGTQKTFISDSTGNYSIIVSYKWSGTISPVKAGYTFNPSVRSYREVISEQLNQDFTSSEIYYTIRGNSGTGNTTIVYSDSSSKTVQSDSTGSYSIVIPYNWSGTVTPIKEGYSFSPAMKNYSNAISDYENQDFTAAAITFSISGNAGIDGAVVSGGINISDTSDTKGVYSLTVPYNWSGTVVLYKTGYTFTPARIEYDNVLSDKTNQDYIAKPVTFLISGNAGLPEVELNYFDTTIKSVLTDSLGNYSFSVAYNWNGFVIPLKSGYTFNPAKRIYKNVLSDMPGQDYSTGIITYTISGNTGIPDVELIYFSQCKKTVYSDSNGHYSFDVLCNWSGTVVPVKQGYSFKPDSFVYSCIFSDIVMQNYVASPVTSVPDMDSEIPGRFNLSQNFPNPFNPSTTIMYSLIKECSVNISVYNIAGEKITELVNRVQNVGNFKVTWNCSGLASGVYIYRITAIPLDNSETYSFIRKMLLLK